MNPVRNITGFWPVLLCLLPGFITAQDFHALAKLDTQKIVIGDQVLLHLKVRYPAGRTIVWPSFGDTLPGGLEILEVGKPDTLVSRNGQETIETRALRITAFDSGQYTIPSFLFRDRADTALYAATGTLLLDVQTVQVDTTEAIKDIKAPLDTPFMLREILPELIFGGCLLLVLAALVWYLLKRKKKILPAPTLPPAPSLPPHEEALEAIRKLKEEKLWQQQKFKEYHTRLTDIIRIYLEKRFGIAAMEMTSDELTTAFRSMTAAPSAIENLQQILRLSDMVKFAKARPIPQENENSMEKAIRFVEATNLPPEEKTAPAPAI